jgi:hypothetical protein
MLEILLFAPLILGAWMISVAIIFFVVAAFWSWLR